jgi:hypothetical protein
VRCSRTGVSAVNRVANVHLRPWRGFGPRFPGGALRGRFFIRP